MARKDAKGGQQQPLHMPNTSDNNLSGQINEIKRMLKMLAVVMSVTLIAVVITTLFLYSALRSGFSDLHNYGVDRASVLRKVTGFGVSPVNKKMSSTFHVLHVDGQNYQVTVKHGAPSKLVNENREPSTWKQCEGIDVAVKIGCPRKDLAALDISRTADIRPGDEIDVVGGKHLHHWRGHFSHTIPLEDATSSGGWASGSAVYHYDEGVFRGDQTQGDSGSPVVNGCGYVGLAHAIISNNHTAVVKGKDGMATDYTAHFLEDTRNVFVVPAKLIKDCIRSLDIERKKKCPSVEVAAPPRLSFC